MQSGGESTREKRVSYVDTVDTDSRRGKRSWKGDLGHRVQHPRKTTTNHRTGSDSSWWRDYGYGSWQGEWRAGPKKRPCGPVGHLGAAQGVRLPPLLLVCSRCNQ